MRAMQLDAPGRPLRLVDRAVPEPGPGEILVRVAACGVCRTDLHVVDGELEPIRSPIVPGHEIVGRVAGLGQGVEGLAEGRRVGVPWLGHSCGRCPYCLAGRENLCDQPLFSGYTVDGGYAGYAAADERYCLPIPDNYSDAEEAWRGAAQRTVDDAEMKYVVVHLHRLLEPDGDGLPGITRPKTNA